MVTQKRAYKARKRLSPLRRRLVIAMVYPALVSRCGTLDSITYTWLACIAPLVYTMGMKDTLTILGVSAVLGTAIWAVVYLMVVLTS